MKPVGLTTDKKTKPHSGISNMKPLGNSAQKKDLKAKEHEKSSNTEASKDKNAADDKPKRPKIVFFVKISDFLTPTLETGF